MPNIRDFTSALRLRPGVDAVLILGKDGLLIEGFATPGLHNEDLAAHVPDLVAEAGSLGLAGGAGVAPGAARRAWAVGNRARVARAHGPGRADRDQDRS